MIFRFQDAESSCGQQLKEVDDFGFLKRLFLGRSCDSWQRWRNSGLGSVQKLLNEVTV